MKIIANPRAGHGKGEENIARLEDLIRRRGLDCQTIRTERPGHATEIAERAVADADPRVAVMGGDGTTGEVVEALAGTSTELALLSVGTGNDVARSLQLPYNDLERGLDVAVDGAARPIDVGRDRERHFVSVLGLGFPAVVADEANRATWLKGPPAFFFSVYKALHRMRAAPLRIELDGETMERDCVAVMIHNTPFTGGGLRMAPEARVDDGQLDVVIVEEIGRLDLMRTFPRAYSGRHLEHGSFSVHRARSIRISSAVPMPKMFDGDLHGRTPVDVSVVPAGLRLVTPPPSGER